MNTRVLLATLAGGLVSFLLGWLVFGVLLMSYYNSMMTPEGTATMRAEPIFWAYILSGLVWSLMLALVYNRWAGISTFRMGAIAGAVIGFLVSLSIDLGFYAGMNLWDDPVGFVVDPLANAVVGAAIGGVIGWVLGYKQGK